MLGGIVYLSLCLGGPISGYLLRNYNQAMILGLAICGNTFFTLLWGLTPTGNFLSKTIFISLRFVMGLFQSSICVFLPIWVNEYSPIEYKTTWMAFLQASVPIGVMSGYIAASVVSAFAKDGYLFDLQLWRWPIIIEVSLLLPFCVSFFLMPSTAFNLNLNSYNFANTEEAQEKVYNTNIDTINPVNK